MFQYFTAKKEAKNAAKLDVTLNGKRFNSLFAFEASSSATRIL
jgi:hypothetical protein